MDLNAAARRGGSWLAGDDTAERVATLASTTMAGTTFGPGLLPRSGLDQALATGIVAATNHGLVMTSQSACAALARRLARDDGTPSGRARAYLAQAAVSAGMAAAGAAAERVLAPRPGEPVRRAMLRTAGQRGVRAGLAGAAVAAVAAADAAAGGRRPGLRLLAAAGVRFVNLALTRQEIADVTGVPLAQVKAPVRAFAGLASGPTVDVRVDLVMEDLARLGAFDRSVLCVASPTGSGYVNYVAIETLEYLTRGDCATVALQYSLRPSLLSLDRVGMAREQNRALLHALEWRLQGLPEGRRPRLVGFGESLGAHTMQDAFLYEGVSGLHRVGLDRTLFIGTPADSKWARQWRVNPEKTDPDGEVAEVASYAEWLALPADDRARRRYVLLSHHEDPVTRFEPALIVQRPGWLGPAACRPPGISHLASWYPLTTFVLTLVDVKNAMNVTPGRFAPAATTTAPTWPAWSARHSACPSRPARCSPSSTRCGAARPNGPGAASSPSNCTGPRRLSSARPGAGA